MSFNWNSPAGFTLVNNTTWSIAIQDQRFGHIGQTFTILPKTTYSTTTASDPIYWDSLAAVALLKLPNTIPFVVDTTPPNGFKLNFTITMTIDIIPIDTPNVTVQSIDLQTDYPLSFTVSPPVLLSEGVYQFTLINENSSPSLRPLKISSHLVADAALQGCYVNVWGPVYKLQPDGITYTEVKSLSDGASIDSNASYVALFDTNAVIQVVYFWTNEMTQSCLYSTPTSTGSSSTNVMEIDSSFINQVNSNYVSRLLWTVQGVQEKDTSKAFFTVSLNSKTITNGTDLPLYIAFPALYAGLPIQVSLPVGTSAEFASADLEVLKISFVNPPTPQ